MFSKILVPLDGSSLAEQALPLARQFAEDRGAHLVFLRVVPYFTVLAADPLLYEEMNRLGEDEATAYLRRVRNELADPQSADLVCEVGSAADSILQYAQNNDVDLILMSSHGRSGLNRWVYGSVAERIMSQAPCPTLIVKADHSTCHGIPEKMLVTLDGSELAEKALPAALELAALGSQLHFLRVTTSGHIRFETDSMAEVFTDIESSEVAQAQEYLQEQADKLGIADVVLAVEVTKSSIAEAIIEYAVREDIGLIVMSSHGRTGLQRWVYGSVAEKVLHTARCATMIVRNN